MKQLSNFFIGLSSGLLLSLVFFFANPVQSENEEIAINNTAPDVSNGFPSQESNPLKGEYLPLSEAQQLISAYSNDFISNYKLPENLTTGGYFGRKHLRDVVGIMGGEDYVKYDFCFSTGDDGSPQIGIIFYPNEGSTDVLKTGSQAFCPVLCDYPRD